MGARYVRPGVPLAVAPTAIHRGADGFFLLVGSAPPPPNERLGDVAVVHLRGPLEHHADEGGDSYDALCARMREAFDGGEDGPPKAVVMRVDSVGGVVSGLNETVRALRRLSAASGVPLYAYVDELAASAAYALCCAAEEIWLPRSGILGSVGTISTMMSQARADARAGLDFAILTSGARKADGHVHAPLTPAGQAAELGRVNRLAAQFFALVGASRHLPPERLKSYEAGLFLGKEALIAGLADAVDGWDAAITSIALANSATLASHRPNSSPAQGAGSGDSGDGPMSKVTLAALVKRTQAQLAEEKDPKRKKALLAALEAYRGAEAAFKKTISHKETHEGDADSEDDGGDKGADDDSDSDSEEESEEEEAKGNETKRRSDDSEDSEEEDSEESEEESEMESKYSEAEEKKAAKALLPTLRQLTGRQGSSAVLGVLRSTFTRAAKYDSVVADVRKLKADQQRSRVSALVDRGVRDGKLTPAQARFWRGQKDEAQLKAYLDVTPKGAIVRTEEVQPGLGIDGEAFGLASGAVPGSEGIALTAEQRSIMATVLDAAKQHVKGEIKVDDFLAAARATNGAERRY